MASLSLKHIYKVYDGNVKAVNDFCMEIEDKEFIVFVGPSGCGKSTTLRMIAGLEDITAGELRIDNEVVNDHEPKDRNIAMVFQNYALYPHMTVYENMAFALRTIHMPNDQIHEKVTEAAEILGITEYLERKPKALSGGQRQRVALGRAIVRNPKVFLLDEPLSNLDAKLRASMRTEISRLHERLQTTFIYVTHDQVEAMTMGTRIVVMKDGFVQQIDTPQNLYKYPANKFVAGFIGTPQMNFFDGAARKNGENVKFSLDCGAELDIDYSLVNRIQTKYLDGEYPITLGVRPDDVRLDNGELSDKDWAKRKVIVGLVEALGGETLIYANLNVDSKDEKDGMIIVKADADCTVRRGDIVDIAINKRKIHVFDKESGSSIKPRLPHENIVRAKISGSISFAGQSFDACGAFANICEADAELTIPTDAVKLGCGNAKATVTGVEAIGNKTLYELTVNGDVLFAAESGEARYRVGEELSFALELSKLSSDELKIDALKLENSLSGKFVKKKIDRKRYDFYLQVGNQEILADDAFAAKLFAVKDTKVFALDLEYIIPVTALSINTNDVNGGFNGVVTDVYDYGDSRYVAVDVEGEKLVASSSTACVGEQVYLSVDQSAVTVKDKALDIIIA